MLVIVKPTLVKELTKKKKKERKMNVRILSFRFFVIFRSVTSDTWPSTRITNFTAHKSEIFFSFRSFKDKNSWGYIYSLLRLYERSFHRHSPFKRILKFFFHATISRPYNTIQNSFNFEKAKNLFTRDTQWLKAEQHRCFERFWKSYNVKTMTFSFLIQLY